MLLLLLLALLTTRLYAETQSDAGHCRSALTPGEDRTMLTWDAACCAQLLSAAAVRSKLSVCSARVSVPSPRERPSLRASSGRAS